MKLALYILFLCCFSLCACQDEIDANIETSNEWKILGVEDIDYCASDFSVGYSLFKRDESFFVAYYDTNHVLILASRNVNEKKWKYKRLDSYVDWDSHKYLTLFVEEDGTIHLAGNMHASPLIYYKSTSPFDIETVEKEIMVGMDEDVTTYPQFLYADNMLFFHYRNGVSGNGEEVFNSFNRATKKWKRLLDVPLFDGKGVSNAYMEGPVLGVDGYFHLVWVWRDTPDCRTNHGLYYAKSKDLKEWEDIKGNKKSIPIDIYDDSFMVDDIPIEGGLLNIGFKLGFDSDGRVIIAYHKYDENGCTNIYVAYSDYNLKQWITKGITSWDWRWNFGGTGSIVCELFLNSIWGDDSSIHIIYDKQGLGYKELVIEKALMNTLKENDYDFYPKSIDELISKDIPNLVVNKIFDSGETELLPYHKYLLRYEVVNINRDEKPDVQAFHSTLRLYEIKK